MLRILCLEGPHSRYDFVELLERYDKEAPTSTIYTRVRDLEGKGFLKVVDKKMSRTQKPLNVYWLTLRGLLASLLILSQGETTHMLTAKYVDERHSDLANLHIYRMLMQNDELCPLALELVDTIREKLRAGIINLDIATDNLLVGFVLDAIVYQKVQTMKQEGRSKEIENADQWLGNHGAALLSDDFWWGLFPEE